MWIDRFKKRNVFMNWIDGLQQALNYIEENITEELDIEEIAARSFSSPYHFQRVFSILCGYTLGEYIRNRRLTLAGIELMHGKIKVIDAALKYGYESPDSFAKAFQKFHGVIPSQAKSDSVKLKNFSPLSIKVSLEGGNFMNYKITKKPKLSFVGIQKHFDGAPEGRYDQAHDFCVNIKTRFAALALEGMSENRNNLYHVITNISDEGFDFTLATITHKHMSVDTAMELDRNNFNMFSVIDIPSNTYVTVQTDKGIFALKEHMDLRQRLVSEWLPNSGYELTNDPEIVLVHSDYEDCEKSYVELWLPIKKINR